MDSNNRLLERIQKDFRELELSDKKERLDNQVGALFSRAEKFFEEGNLINARLEFQAILGLQPGHKAARRYITQIEGQFTSFVQSFYRQGMIAFAEEDYGVAREAFEKVLAIQPDHKQASSQLKRCNRILKKRKKEAQAAAQKDIVERTYGTALTAYSKGRFEQALTGFSKIVKMEPGHVQARRYAALSRDGLYKQYLKRGKDFVGKGQWDLAIKDLKKASSYKPGSDEVRKLLADARRRWDLQNKVLSQNLYKHGLEAFLSGNKNKARTAWQKAIAKWPQWVWDALREASIGEEECEVGAIDGTTLTRSDASQHYLRRIDREDKVGRPVQEVLLVDVRKRIFLAWRIRAAPRGEKCDVPYLIRTCPVLVDGVLMDKGFDSNPVHTYLREEGIWSVAPVRKGCRRGRYR